MATLQPAWLTRRAFRYRQIPRLILSNDSKRNLTDLLRELTFQKINKHSLQVLRIKGPLLLPEI